MLLITNDMIGCMDVWWLRRMKISHQRVGRGFVVFSSLCCCGCENTNIKQTSMFLFSVLFSNLVEALALMMLLDDHSMGSSSKHPWMWCGEGEEDQEEQEKEGDDKQGSLTELESSTSLATLVALWRALYLQSMMNITTMTSMTISFKSRIMGLLIQSCAISYVQPLYKSSSIKSLHT